MQAVQFRIARPTNNLSAITRFYTDGLGLPLIGSFEKHAGYDGVMIGLPGQGHHLEFTQHEQAVSTVTPSGDHLLVLYFDKPEGYAAAIERLKGFGGVPVAPENPYWADKSEPFKDPDGWRVVLYNGVYE